MCACLSRAQSFPPAWSSTATYAAGDTVQYGGNWYRAVVPLSAGGPYPAAAYDKWELNYVRSNTTLTIGAHQGFANLVYAWQFARNARIADAAYLHFSIVTTSGDFNESFSAPFSLDHGSGALISVIGDDASKITLKFPSSNGFVLDGAHGFGTLSHVTLVGGSSANALSPGQGISVLNGATIGDVSDSTIEYFKTGVYAYEDASAYLDSATVISGCNVYVKADQSAAVTYGGFNVTLTLDNQTILYANHNATIVAESSTINTNLSDPNDPGVGVGALAQNGGVIDINSSTLGIMAEACMAEFGGRITVTNGFFNMGNGYGTYADHGGTINETGADDAAARYIDSGNGSYVYGP